MQRKRSRFAVSALSLIIAVVPVFEPALACTRTLYVGANGTVITGRNMDWSEDMSSNLWDLPRRA